jgi:hypothetical protein
MHFGIGFDERTMDTWIHDRSHKGLTKINLFPLIKSGRDHASIAELRTTLAKLTTEWSSDDSLVTSYEPLNADVRDSLRRQYAFDYQEYDQLCTLATQFILYSRKVDRESVGFLPPADRIQGPADVGGQWKPGLYGRYGIVELRIVENYLRNRAGLKAALRKLIGHLHDQDYMYREASRPHWLSASDIDFNLRKLMTNAGFYIDSEGAEEDIGEIHRWATEYLAALGESRALFPAPGCYPSYFIAQDYLFRHQGSLRDYVNFPSPARFYESLAGQSILFVTPFYREVNALFQSEKIFNLYKDIAVPRFRLRAIPAYISTYPNRPHESWSETFEKILVQIDEAFNSGSFTIFFASCGCYGMPVCSHVSRKYGIASVYYGNHVNTLFGVRQAGTENFLPDRRILENWAVGKLGEFRNVEKIDGGRYV